MRIAQVSPLTESVPPKLYGGTERIVSYLTEELVRQGHDVTLFASGDSVTNANLVACCPRALRLDKCSDPLTAHVLMLEKVAQQSDEFDIIHFHTDYLHFPISRRLGYAHVTTLHGRLDLPELVPLYQEFCEVPLVSISSSQQLPLSWVDWQACVYHGLPLNLYEFHQTSDDYLAFLGRISPEKRIDLAIEIARRSNMKLKVAAKIDPADQRYFETEIRHLLDAPFVEYVGEVGEKEKDEFLGNAKALLFPIDWPEPFGLVLIEALACGTPVIALNRGSVPEILSHGISGFICNSIDEAVAAIQRLAELSRYQCRALFEKRFNVERMAKEYVEVYKRVIQERAPNGRHYRSKRSILYSGEISQS